MAVPPKFVDGLASVKKDTNGCWLWTGNIGPKGYGRVNFNGKYKQAHRLSWEWFVGSIPEGLFVCHKCDVPRCINPDHLFVGTNSDNMADMARKGRANSRFVPGHDYNTGEKNGRAVLSKKDVSKIRSVYKSGDVTQREIAQLYGVCRATISNVLTGKYWKDNE